MAVPDLDLGPIVRQNRASKPKTPVAEVSLELSEEAPGSFANPDAFAPSTHDRFEVDDEGRPSSKKQSTRKLTAHEEELLATEKKTADEAAMRALAAYGPAPTAIYLAPIYAFKVRARRKELAVLLQSKRDLHTAAETKLEDALAGIAERAMHLVEQMPPFAPLLHPAKLAEQNLRTKGGALAAEMDSHRGKLADTDKKIAAAEREALTATQALQLAPTDEARKKAKDNAEHRVASARKERQALDAHWQKQITARGAVVDEARGALRRALAQIARRVVADTAAFGAEWDRDRVEVTGLDKDVALKKKELDRYVTAEASYDVSVYQKGFGVTAAVGLFLLLCLLIPRTLKILGVL